MQINFHTKKFPIIYLMYLLCLSQDAVQNVLGGGDALGKRGHVFVFEKEVGVWHP